MGEHPTTTGGSTFMTSFMVDRPAGPPPHECVQAVVARLGPSTAKTSQEEHSIELVANGGQSGLRNATEVPRLPPPQWFQAQFDQDRSLLGVARAAYPAQGADVASARQPSSRRRSSRRAAPQGHRNGTANKRHATGAGSNAQNAQARVLVDGSGAQIVDVCSSVLSADLDPRIAKMLEASKVRMLLATEIRALLLYDGAVSERPSTDTPDWAIYRECPKQRRRARNSDRWANSGGMKGSRDLPYNSSTPYVRRRYGSVFVHKDPGHKGKRCAQCFLGAHLCNGGLLNAARLLACRYYEYTLLSTAEDGSLVEDKTKTLFHILPSPGMAIHQT